MTIEEIHELLTGLFVTYGVRLLWALLVLVIGWWIIGRLLKVLDKTMNKGKVEVTLQRFLHSFIGIALKVVLLVIFASMVGIETASLIAMLGAAGLAVGLALQGSLANFAGGVLILMFKPFRAGDVVEAQGYLGIVQEIQIFHTMLLTLDNQRVIIPNGILSNGCIKNLSAEKTRRVDMKFGISYEDDIDKAKAVVAEVMAENSKVLSDPGPDIYVSGHADSAIILTVRPWCKTEHYWDVYFATHEHLKKAFDQADITIPFPQRDLHLKPQQLSSLLAIK